MKTNFDSLAGSKISLLHPWQKDHILHLRVIFCQSKVRENIKRQEVAWYIQYKKFWFNRFYSFVSAAVGNCQNSGQNAGGWIILLLTVSHLLLFLFGNSCQMSLGFSLDRKLSQHKADYIWNHKVLEKFPSLANAKVRQNPKILGSSLSSGLEIYGGPSKFQEIKKIWWNEHIGVILNMNISTLSYSVPKLTVFGNILSVEFKNVH